VSEAHTLWADLASRVIRVALECKGVGYAGLADTLTSIGVKETERSLISPRLARDRQTDSAVANHRRDARPSSALVD
jgi:hypothetical protein